MIQFNIYVLSSSYHVFFNFIQVCKLPCNTGDTSGSYCFFEYSEWYYDETSNQCKAFTYSGCGGNLNRFHDKVTCESVCTRQYDTSYSGDSEY